MKGAIKRIAMVLLCGVVFLSGFQLYDIYCDQKISRNIFENLAYQLVHGEGKGVVSNDGKASDKNVMLRQYQNMAKHNADFVGWIWIDHTRINYPVMQTVEHPDYYLKRDFNGGYNRHGVPYVEESCNVLLPSDNITIYGHHMKDGTMFSDLCEYKQESFYKSHPIIHFNTLKECNDYQIIAAFKTVVYSDKGFEYDMFHDAKTKEEFSDYVSNVKSRELYDTGVSAVYGDKLITLSTCDYNNKNGRVVVVAKRLK